MGTLTFAAPILPGRLDEHRRFVREIATKGLDHATSRRKLGIDKERAFYQKLPDGNTILIVHVEGPGTDDFMQQMLDADAPYDRWFKERIADIHGMDLRAGLPPMPKQAWLLDTDAPKNDISSAFAVPLPPEEVEAWWDMNREGLQRKAEFKASREAMGITRECVHLAETPMGPLVLVYLEGADAATMSEVMLASDKAVDRWFVDAVSRLHGLDFRKLGGVPNTEMALDWTTQKGVHTAKASYVR